MIAVAFLDELPEWTRDLHDWLHHDAPKLIVIFVLAIILTRLLHVLTDKLHRLADREEEVARGRAQQMRTLAGVIHGGGWFVIIFVAALEVLPLLGVNIGPLLASAGVAGLAVGFGAQTLVRDVINGFFILMESQYQVGDVVRIGGVQGTVEILTLRRTVLRDSDGTVHNIPNSQVSIVSNLTRGWAQTSLQVAVAYTENSDKVIEVLRQVCQEFRKDPEWNATLVADPEVPGIDRIAGGEVDYLVLAKTRPGQQHPVGRELRRRIKEAFEKSQIQAPGPARIFLGDAQRQPQPPEAR